MRTVFALLLVLPLVAGFGGGTKGRRGGAKPLANATNNTMSGNATFTLADDKGCAYRMPARMYFTLASAEAGCRSNRGCIGIYDPSCDKRGACSPPNPTST